MSPLTPDQVGKVLALVRAHWPGYDLGSPDEANRVWSGMLQAFTGEQVADALKELAMTGDRRPPTAGLVAKTIVDRAISAPAYDEMRVELVRAIRAYRPPRDVAFTNPYAPPPADYWSHPSIAAFAEHSWNEWRMAPDPECGDHQVVTASRTFYAQQRDAYKALTARVARDASLAAIGVTNRGSLPHATAPSIPVGAPRRGGPAQLQPGAGLAHLEPAGGGDR